MTIICELSFEVCNKVGGIYTVVSSKVQSLQKRYSRYIAIGPWFRGSQHDFIQADINDVPQDIQTVFDELFKKGIYCTYGYWGISGKPETILIDHKAFMTADNSNYLKKKYWDNFQVDSLFARYDFDEPLIFATAAGMLIESLSKTTNEKIVAQLHEWMSGFAGLYLKSRALENEPSNVSCFFTTHATMLGRSLTARGVDCTKLKKGFDADSKAKEIGVQEKHSMEKACANHLDGFSTVSSLTAKEAELFFGVKPIKTFNGLNESIFPSGKNLVKQQLNSKNALSKVLKWKFGDEDFSEHTFIYTSGRPEFHNKGFDSLVLALQKLQQNNKKVVCFFFVPWQHYGLKEPDTSVSTHHMENEYDHEIIKACREAGLDNSGSVKVILYPPYLGSDADVLFEGDYYTTISGCDLGVFPSSYEPWGYTPMESCAVGVPAITSDDTGFGEYCKKKRMKGIHIIKKGVTEVVELASIISDYTELNSEEHLHRMILAKEVAKKCDWENFVENYVKMYGK